MSTRLDRTPQERARLARLAHFESGNNNVASNGKRSASNPFTAVDGRVGRTLTESERINVAVAKLQRAAGSSVAIDILHASLSKALSSPTVERFRKVDVSNGVFRKSVASCPGSVELLHTVGFEPMHGHLVLQKHNPQLIKHAVDALNVARSSSDYKEAKAKREAATDAAAAAVAAEEQARVQRAEALAKVPAEPSADDAASCCQVSIQVSEGAPIARRRFDSENVLADLENYVRSLPEVPLGASLRLENITTRPPKEMDLSRQQSCTLYALDLWPVGRVRVLPSHPAYPCPCPSAVTTGPA